MSLEGKRAIVTGGASGIGLAVVKLLAARGARVAVLDLDDDGARKAAGEVDGTATQVDVRDHDAVLAAVASAAESLGGLDILVNNAGAGMVSPLHQYKEKDWSRIIDINLKGVFNGIKAAAPIMLDGGGGAIVNNASLSGLRPTRGELPYSAAKAGVMALTQGAAQEYGPTVRVNCVAPGLIRTPLTEPLFGLPGGIEPVEKAVPLARAGTAEEVAELIVFLASERASYITGQNIVIDGGMSLPQVGVDEILRGLLPAARKPG